jgi:hypothetical protein
MRMIKSIPIFMLTLVTSAIRPAAADRWSHLLVGENVSRIQYDQLNGIYWFGTDGNGLWRYDGLQFEHVSPASLKHVTALALDAKHDALWVGTPTSLHRFHFKTNVWEYFNKDSGLSENSVTALFVDRRGILWYGFESEDEEVGGGLGKGSTGWYRFTTTEYAKWDSAAASWVPIQGVEPIPSNSFNYEYRSKLIVSHKMLRIICSLAAAAPAFAYLTNLPNFAYWRRFIPRHWRQLETFRRLP